VLWAENRDVGKAVLHTVDIPVAHWCEARSSRQGASVTERYKALPQQMKSPRFTFYVVTARYYKQIKISEKHKYYSTATK
jgi:hypothetical protein